MVHIKALFPSSLYWPKDWPWTGVAETPQRPWELPILVAAAGRRLWRYACRFNLGALANGHHIVQYCFSWNCPNGCE